MRSALLLVVLLFGLGPVQGDKIDSAAAGIGGQVFDSRCANVCHQAPAARRLKPKQWRIVLNTMQVRMQSIGMPPLTEEQIDHLLAYLTEKWQ